MSRRIAHRPRYNSTRPTPHAYLRAHHEFLHIRWSYRRQTAPFQKRSPGQSLLNVARIPWSYHLFRGAIPLIR